MKPFLGVNVTNDPQNETLNGEEFIVAKAPAALSQELDKNTDEVIALILKPALPLPAEIAQWVSGLIGIVGAIMVVSFYYILELEYGQETWGLWFPCYELSAFEALTGLKGGDGP